MIYDIDKQHLEDLTAAFAAGEARGRDHSDEDLMAECVALRVRLASREHLETITLNVCATACVLGCWASIAWLVFAR